ncbi:MAG TPA: protein-L-isoaspartate O-methyltransferase [Nocardioidaceae bacterium]|nr:protein-L-isoaspartate O-methyltransferase [Nocardioidaceae bacterium]
MTPDSVLDAAFGEVSRADFLPELVRSSAGQDRALPIGHNQTNSQPSTVRAMLRLLDVREGQRVLDVGCGSAWSTALLARLVGPTGSVVGVELVPELVAFGRSNLSAQHADWTRVEHADPNVLGFPEGAPYDRILVSAEATNLPDTLVDQLGEDGVLVVPVAGRMLEVRRSGEPGDPVVVTHGHYSFVPLLGG